MKKTLAFGFRHLFKIPFFKHRFFGIHQKIIKPLKLFNGVECEVNYNGLRLHLKIDDWIQEKIFFLGAYEAAELNVLNLMLKPGDFFLDLGANIGLFSMHAAQIVGKKGKVISFEPFSTNYKALEKHISMNKLNIVQLEKKAVGDSIGEITLYLDEDEKNLGMATAQFVENAKEEKVPLITVDAYMENTDMKQLDFVKIDIEGFEYPTLLGMENSLRKFRPKILIEILPIEQTDQNYQNVDTFLSSIGYVKYFISDKGEISNVEANTDRNNYFYACDLN